MKKYVIIIILLSLLCLSLKAQLIRTTGSLHTPRRNHCSELLADGRVLAFGGDDGNSINDIATNTAELFDPLTQVWFVTGSMNRPRTKACSALLDNGNVLVAGGEDADGNKIASCEIYDKSSGTWSYTDSLNVARTQAEAIKLNNGEILVVAGKTEFSCELYNQISNLWTLTFDDISYSRTGSFWLIKLANGNIYLTGGKNEIAEVYNPPTDSWINVVQHVLQDLGRMAIMMWNGKVLITGGETKKNSSEFYPATETYTNTGDLLNGESDCQLINLSNGKVLILGLGVTSAVNRGCLQLYDPVTGTWSIAGNTGPTFGARLYTAHTLHDGNILYTGGMGPVAGAGAQSTCYMVGAGILTGMNESPEVPKPGIFPNPNSGVFDLSMPGSNSVCYELRIMNALGKIVFETHMNDGNGMLQVRMENAAAGLYSVVLKQGDAYSWSRVIVQ